MTIYAVRLKRNNEPEYCWVYEKNGELYHAHANDRGEWNDSRFTIETVDHHLTLYHKNGIVTDASKDKLPDFVREEILEEG